ncbi:MAG: hypothetical protein R3281_04265 [Balneolaceae bacterium]|nr:hypothetical protein [Balneolaceae bacterium]
MSVSHYSFFAKKDIAFLFMLGLLLSGCELLGLSGGEEKEEPVSRFSYEVIDQERNVTKSVTNQQVEETEFETGLGLYGDQFLPPSLIENFDVPPELFRRHEIYLHAENGVDEDVQFVSLRFGFPLMESWEAARYTFPETTKEELLERLRMLRDRFRGNTGSRAGLFVNEPGSELLQTNEHVATMSYFDSGLVTRRSHGKLIELGNYFYQAIGGYIELTDVYGERIKGQFSVDMISLPMDLLFFSDTFPENPDVDTYRIVGEFETVPGNYADLQQARAELFQEYYNAGLF